MQFACNYTNCMARNVQIRNFPEELHRKLKARAAMKGMSISDYLLLEIKRILEVPTLEEWRKKWATRERTNPSPSSAEIIREERDSR